MQSSTEWEVQDYPGLLLRRWRLVAAWALVGLLVGVLLFAVLPRTYRASSAVLVTTSVADTGAVFGGRTSGGIVNLDTEASIVTSSEVLLPAAESLGWSYDDLQNGVSINVPPNSAVMEIRFTAADPQEAAAGANAVAKSYLAGRKAVAEDKLDSDAAPYEASLKETRADLRSARTSQERFVLQQQYQAIEAELRNIKATAISAGRVIQPAVAPSSPASPDLIMVVGGSIALFFVAGLIAAFVKDSRDPRIHSRRQAAALVGLDDVEAGRDRNITREMAAEVEHTAGRLAARLSVRPDSLGSVAILAVGAADGQSVARHLSAMLRAKGWGEVRVEVVPDRNLDPAGAIRVEQSVDVIALAAVVGVDTKPELLGALREAYSSSPEADLELMAWAPAPTADAPAARVDHEASAPPKATGGNTHG